MIRRGTFIFLFIYTAIIISAAHSDSKEREFDINELKKGAPKIFLDCRRCDHDFIKKEIPFVNYVWDRKEADVHVLVTTQRTGAGGTEYTMTFIGQEEYANIQDTLKYVSKRIDTREETRRGMVRVLKMGLIPYIARTPIAELISILFEEKVLPTAVEDRWNFWVFHISLNGSLDGEKLSKYVSLRGNLSASRITPESKLRMGFYANFNESNFDIEEETISSYSDRKSFSGLYVKSISDHWSIGAWLSAYSSTYNNIALSLSPTPAIEYNLFPYSESTRRQLRFLYRIGYSFSRYEEETIYEKTSESLFSESLSITFELKEPWGNASTTLTGSHYFHDFSINRLELFGHLSLRVFKGLSLSMWGGFTAIHDQLSLPLGKATLDEILLQRKELETNFEYFASIGFSYTFGSVYSNVVNPRFGK